MKRLMIMLLCALLAVPASAEQMTQEPPKPPLSDKKRNALLRYMAVLFGVVIATAVSAVVGYLMARNANKVFGMVNGDILGATNEVSRPVVMVSMLLPFICWL